MIILAQVHYKQRQFPAAESYAKQALEIAKTCNLSEANWRANHMLGKIHMRGKTKEAKHEYLEAKQALESMTSKLKSELKQTFLNKNEIKEFYRELGKIGLKK
jgi:predicted DNA-binding ArsR family transcriptional regulator